MSSATRVRPRAHWGLLALTLLALLVALLVQSLSNGVGQAATSAGGRDALLPGGHAVVYRDATGITSRALPERTVALTFDDGPDPAWTPQVLDILAREHVPATFFVVGQRAAAHPELVRRVLALGDEIGSHTWSHTDLAAVPSWRRHLELSLGQLALEGSASVSSALLRPPYSSTPSAIGPRQLQVLEEETRDGYVVVLSDRDTEDWSRPGVARIVAAATPDGHGAVVQLHDAGGDRSQTVAALPAIIERYRAAGYRFTTVSQGLGLAPTAAVSRGAVLPALQGRALLLSVRLARWAVTAIGFAALALGLLSLLRTLLVLGLARPHVRLSRRRLAGPEWLPAVSVVVPAYNEVVGIERSLRSLVANDLPDLEVVVVDDGSTDGTGDLVEALALPRVRLVRQPNAGKAAALVRGVAEARHDVLVMLDGDTIFEADTIRALVQPMRDPAVGAVSGNTKVGNRGGLLGRWQHLEYVSGFNLDRRLMDLMGAITTVPGAAGAFRRQALADAGGLSTDTLAEDTDITMAVLRAGWKVVHEERARAWTEAPSSVGDLWRQRYRWGYGTLQCVWKHRHALVEGGRSRRLGLFGLPYMLSFQVLLPLLAPAIDVFALHGILTGEGGRVAVIWGVYGLVSALTAAYALWMVGEGYGPLWSLPLQQFFYRQLIYLVVVQSVASALSGVHLPWHKLERTGDVVVPA